MNYANFKNELLTILQNSDDNLVLKMYDKDGNSTVDSEELQWIFITNFNIMIEMPILNNSITIWLADKNKPKDFEALSQKIRKQAILNGLSLIIKMYNNFDRRKMYNIIKTSLNKLKRKNMNESFNELKNIFKHTSLMFKNTKKQSDFYLSESLHAKNVKSLLETYLNILTGINDLNKKSIKSFIKTLAIENLNKTDKLLENLYFNNRKDFKKLYEHKNILNKIENITKEKFLNNYESKQYKNIIYISENAFSYITKPKNDKENLIKAYNHLLSLSENLSRTVDLLRVIKNNKLCETYNISKDSLIDFWLDKNNKKIKNNLLFVIENYKGEKSFVSKKYKPVIHLLTQHISNGGSSNDLIYNNILSECDKYNSLYSLIETYKYSSKLKPYIKTIYKLFKESNNKIKSKLLNEESFKNIYIPIDYKYNLYRIENKLGLSHDALKYIAIYEREKELNENLLFENKTRYDKKIIIDSLKKLTSYKKANEAADIIIKSGLFYINPLKESNNEFDNCKKMIDNIKTLDSKTNSLLNECLFTYSLNENSFDSAKKKFIKTLKKYIKG